MFKKTFFLSSALLMVLASGPYVKPDQSESRNPIMELIRRLELGKPLSHGSLTIIPVHMDKIQDRRPYSTLEESLARGWVTITEVEGGRVPQVKISNTSKRLIFLMGGEVLTGCRQDRILAGDILLAPGTKDLQAPVYCVEHGRWSATSDRFTSKQNLGTPALRAKAQEKPAAAQSEIWARIAEQNREMGVSSSTDAFQDAYDKEENRVYIQEVEKRMKDIPRLHDDTVGVVIGLNGEVVSVDVFANPGLFARQWPKILRSSALSSIGSSRNGSLGRDEAAGFLRSFTDRNYRRKSGLDLGFEYASIDAHANILALAYKRDIVHLSAFPQEKDRIKVIR